MPLGKHSPFSQCHRCASHFVKIAFCTPSSSLMSFILRMCTSYWLKMRSPVSSAKRNQMEGSVTLLSKCSIFLLMQKVLMLSLTMMMKAMTRLSDDNVWCCHCVEEKGKKNVVHICAQFAIQSCCWKQCDGECEIVSLLCALHLLC